MSRWIASLEQRPYVLCVLSALLLTLSAAPFGQWYLAWIALVPMLIAVSHSHSLKSAFARGWFAGVVCFGLNEWWLWTATVPGTVGVVICSGFYWGLAAALIYYLRLLPPAAHDGGEQPVSRSVRISGVAIVWVATEWLRCNTVSEFPWLPIGATQSPAVVICQIADFAGIWGVSFVVILANALFATAWIHRGKATRLWLSGGLVATVVLLTIAYGTWRIKTTPNQPGPQIMLVQSNHPHVRGGASTTTPQEAAQFFLAEIEKQLGREHADLVILPENEFPPLNDEARSELAQTPVGPALEAIYQRLVALSQRHKASILVGGAAVTGWTTEGKEHIGAEIRNSAFLFSPDAKAVARYDKIHLVPFSERLPFSTGPAWLANAALYLAASRAVQPLHPGTFEDLHPFTLTYATESGAQALATFVTPICLENIDPVMTARLARDPATGLKRAEFFANLSNDGWFHDQEKYQHLQLLVFRCIENRVPLARTSNTGISGFIDSCGRVVQQTKPDQTAVAVHRLTLDNREAFYMAHPDVFPIACVIVVAIALAIHVIRSSTRKSPVSHAEA